ncbi:MULTISPECIES: cytidine deaminase [Francisella]|uniref:Cytidine deaminase n=1 Tax=Francisella opportunistica TaxID=2016517 RepID=A0A345JS54_9GAMM|nr:MULTISPECIES: cytidine deaminase [Francisella]APC91911.1 Cytidine deaminase [Francisella sp. MA067296]AXH30150.1 cytidine deaminase [Francisella opportunistica]AXH31792.1 cytidine deaminase [Francisella opportunistica]AXH33438.1 cytidine deaminase [Francisella opportunistica]
MTQKQDQQLIECAKKAFNNAYAPFSGFKVGAALLMKDGKIISSSNVETSILGLSVCAERNVIFYAYSQGYRKDDIIKIAVVADTEKAISPCGACRQIMSEHLNLDCPILLTNINESDRLYTNTKELLPYIFSL